jgi:hypothetical protein
MQQKQNAMGKIKDKNLMHVMLSRPSKMRDPKRIFLIHHPIPWRDSISRNIAPAFSVAGGDDTARPRRHPGHKLVM